MLDGGNLFGHTAHHREGTRDSQGEVRGGQHVAHRLCRQGFDAIACERRASVACHEIVDAQEVTRLLSHQLTAFPQPVTDRSCFFRIDVARGEHAQAKEMGSPPRVTAIMGMLQAFVLLNRGGVGHMHRVAGFHEPINQPLPIIGGFHDEAVYVWLKRMELKKNVRHVIGRSLFVHDLFLLINQYDHTGVAMDVNPAVQFCHGSSLGWKG